MFNPLDLLEKAKNSPILQAAPLTQGHGTERVNQAFRAPSLCHIPIGVSMQQPQRDQRAHKDMRERERDILVESNLRFNLAKTSLYDDNRTVARAAEGRSERTRRVYAQGYTDDDNNNNNIYYTATTENDVII
jgi:hypothetical protein